MKLFPYLAAWTFLIGLALSAIAEISLVFAKGPDSKRTVRGLASVIEEGTVALTIIFILLGAIAP